MRRGRRPRCRAVVRSVLLLLLVATATRAQTLRLHEVVGPGAEDAVTMPVETGPPARVGRVVLDVGPADVESVGLEVEPDGTARLSVWLGGTAAGALADVTATAAGGALAVVVDGRVLATPTVAGSVTNGLVAVDGLRAESGRALAARLRGDLPRASRPAPPEPPRGPPAGDPEGVARAFVEAVARRNWGAAADALHPDAHAALREPALGILRLEGATVRVREGLRDGAFPLSRVLPAARAGSLEALPDRDLAAVYLAGLDALGVWGAPGPPRTVVGRIPDGERVHVLFRGGLEAGRAEVTVVTVRRDGAGRWRALLTEAQGF